MLPSNLIGQKIAAARKNVNLSQAQLAQQISISPQAVGKWERGESMPDVATLSRLAQILGVDLNYFSENFQSTHSITTPAELMEVETPGLTLTGPGKKFNGSWDMSKASWVDADFSGLKNLKEKFSSSNIKNCQFHQADLSELVMASNNIEGCDFSSSNLRNSKIQSSNLLGNQFQQCNFIDAQFTKSNIEKCDFTQANFSGVDVSMVNFNHNVLTDALWQLTTFKNTNLAKVVFNGTIEDCHFEHCSFYGVTFQDATILNTFFKYNKRFKKVEFINCQVDKITYAFLKNNQANLSGITLLP